jgi:sugar phosphate isomerase/epimerase
MKNDRRSFLKFAGVMGAGAFLLPQLACQSSGNDDASAKTVSETASGTSITKGGDLTKFGIQLYTVRDVIFDDPKGTIKQLAGYGFNQIEGYEGDLGIFWGMKNTEFKKYLDDLGIKMVSSHCDIKKDFEAKAAQAAEIGMDYLICPSIGAQPTMEAWKKVTELFNKCGAICKKNGIRFAYHNHAYSFRPFSGIMPHDFLMENTDPDLVDHEMDIYWVITGGADPIEYLKKYPNRFRLCHVKDRMKNAGEEQRATCNLGTGIIDFPSILKVAKDNGMEYFIMEQERYDGSTPLQAAKVGAEYLSQLTFA